MSVTPRAGKSELPKTSAGSWTKSQIVAAWLSASSFIGFIGFVVGSIFVDPIRSESLISIALICVSAAIALFAFTFLANQTANIKAKWLGVTINVGGAIAGFLISYASLQFFVRGTSNMHIELYADSEFQHLWHTPVGRSTPEFSASMKYYSIIAVPEGSNLRLLNLPVFESITISVREPQWQVTKIVSDDHTCTVKGQKLSGWCSEAKVALQFVNCIDTWNGSGSIPSVSFNEVLNHFIQSLHEVQQPTKIKFAIGNETREALATKVDAVQYNQQDFCTAINGAKNMLERTTHSRVQIKIGCNYIGFAVGSDDVPELNEEAGGWRKAC